MLNAVYVFESQKGDVYRDAEKIRDHYWKRILKEAIIPYRTMYQMRHTFASLMLQNGEDILWVSTMLGHKDASITFESYARYAHQQGKQRGGFLLSS